MRLSRIIMGTGVTLDVPGLLSPEIVESAFARLIEIDEQFSTYKKISEVSRFQRGEIDPKDLSADLRHILKQCQDLEKKTDGFFSANFSGKFDPTGYVKGWAIAQASQILEAGGIETYCLSIGGDINFKSKSDKDWQIGIQNPDNKQAVIGVIKAKNLAVATSGSYVRGQHIINPKTRLQPKALKSLTVCGPDITTADVLATAGFAAGQQWSSLIKKFQGFDALAITDKNEVLMTAGMSKLMAGQL